MQDICQLVAPVVVSTKLKHVAFPTYSKYYYRSTPVAMMQRGHRVLTHCLDRARPPCIFTGLAFEVAVPDGVVALQLIAS